MGDLNCNMASTQFDSNARLLCEIFDIYELQQLITEPTHFTESSSSLIDVIFTNCINRVVCSGVLHVGIGDHSLIYVYRKPSPNFAKGIPLKLTEISVISTEKTFAGIFLERIDLVPVTIRVFCERTGKENF